MGRFADLLDDSTPRANMALQLGVDTKPDDAAETVQLARRFNLPTAVVSEFRDDYRAKAKADDAKTAVEGSQKLKGWLAYDDNAKLAHDDVHNLAGMEEAVKQFGQVKAYNGPAPSITSIASGIAQALPQGFRLMSEGLGLQISDLLDALGMEPDADLKAQQMRRIEQEQARVADSTPNFESSTAQGLYSGGTSLLRQVPGIAASIALRNPGPSLGLSGLQVQAEAYGKYRTRGGNPGESFLAATGEGAVEIATEKIPMGFLVDKFGKVGAKAFLGGMLAREVPSEELATFLQDAIDTAVANPDKTWGQFMAERPDAAYQTLLATVVQSGAMGAAHGIAKKLDDKYGQASQAEADAAQLEQFRALTEASALRERDAVSFKDFIAQIAEEDGNTPTELYVDAKVLEHSLAQSGITMDELAAVAPVVASQLGNSQTGTDIRVPVAEFAIADEAITAPLIDHLRVTPDSMSRFEAQAFLKEQGPAIESEVQKALAQHQEQETTHSETEAVRTYFEQQLASVNRFTPEVNKAYASMLSSFFTTQAQRAGLTPNALLQRYGLKVADAPVEQAQALAQSTQTPAFKKWFGDSKVVDTEGKPLVVYHGTQARTQSEGGIESFDISKAGTRTDTGYMGRGFYFGNASTGNAYAGHYEFDPEHFPAGGAVYPVYLSLRNPLLLADRRDENGRRVDLEVLAREALGLDLGVSASELRGALEKQGFDGSIYTSEGGYKEYLALNPEQIKSAIGNDGTFDANDPSILSQRREDLQRGTLSFAQDITTEASVISLMENADLSTVLHESGHFFLEVQADLAARIQQGISSGEMVTEAERGIVEDMNRILDWFGVKATENTSALDEWRNMTLEQKREHHEKWARGFEAFAFEGKSPSIDMRGIFQRFRSWLVSIYKNLTALNVKLTDDVRSVMNRMLASDAAIEEAEAAYSMGPLFRDAESAGMTKEEFDAYQAADGKATDEATTDLQKRAVSDLQWLSRATDKALKARQKEVDGLRKDVEREARSEVMSQPVYRAWAFLTGKTGEAVVPLEQTASTIDTTTQTGKLRTSTVKDLYGEEVWKTLSERHMTSEANGLHPDLIAEPFGYETGEAMVNALATVPKPADAVQTLTDQRMMEKYGDITSQEALQQAANEAVHNEFRARVIARELKALQALGKARGADESIGLYDKRSIDVMAKAAKMYAEGVIARLKVKDIRPNQYTAAEARNSKLAEQAFAAGKADEAAVHKRNQLVNNYAAKIALETKNEIAKALEFFHKVTTGKASTVGKTRDMDVVQAARAVLSAYGLAPAGESAQHYLEVVRRQDPAMYEVLKGPIDDALANAKPYRELSVEDFRALHEEIRGMWHLAKRSRQVEIDGQLVARETIQTALTDRMEAIGVPKSGPGETSAITPSEVRLTKFQSALAALRRVESWAQAKDGSPMGPFRKYVWQPVKEAADAYRADKVKFLKQYRDLLQTIAPTLKRRTIHSPELNYTFGMDQGGVGLSEILHAMAHTGNSSNKRKLLLGRGWAVERADGSLDTTRWDAFMKRLADEKIVTKAHWDFVQGVWDMLEQTKSLAQKAHRDVFGAYFAEVTAEPVSTPFGTYKGGYVPAQADSRIVRDAATRAMAEAENASLQFAFPTTSKGFTKGRVEYNRPLLLDLRTLAQHIDKVMLFSHLEQPVRDVRKVLTSKEVSGDLGKLDPTAFDGVLTPWLNRASRQQVETPIQGDGGLSRFFSALRGRAGMTAMFANVSNAAQQITGFSIAAVKVRPKYLMGAMADWVKGPRDMARSVSEASTYMNTRMANEVSMMTGEIQDILLDPSAYEAAKNWTAKHAYFAQSAVDNVMGPIIWIAARNQALEQGMSDKDAARLADSAVRETQGSSLAEDISRVETGNAFVRMFTQFAGYFNMQANLLGTEFATVSRDLGLRKGAGRAFYVMLFGFLLPAWTAEAIAQAFRGGPDDDDKDGEYLDDWLSAVFLFGTIRNGLAMVPVAGQVANAALNTLNHKPYDDRISMSPAIAMIESAVQAPKSVYEAIAEDGKVSKAVRDVATLTSMVTGIPVAALAKPIAYASDVADDRVVPTGAADAVRGFVTGRASPDSKQ